MGNIKLQNHPLVVVNLVVALANQKASLLIIVNAITLIYTSTGMVKAQHYILMSLMAVSI